MQKVKVAEIKGPLGRGEQKFYAIKGEDGAEFTTFNTKIAEVPLNSIINIEPKVVSKGGKTYVNFDEYEIVEKGTESVNGGSTSFKRDTDAIKLEYQLRSRLQDLKNLSIDGQTAFNGIVSMVNTGKGVDAEIYGLACEWAKRKLTATMATVPPSKQVEPKRSEVKEPEQQEKCKSIGDLLTFCSKNGIDRKKFLELVEITEADIPKPGESVNQSHIRDYIDKKDSELWT